ncbi:MAG: chemotaxis-specific protein-glutamate methyltransferase CheB [Deltaproteobacteria bacterium]
MPRIRVLVVDDSAFARKVMREVLTGAGMEVVGIARDGLEALEKIEELKPDVITLDLVMPNLDGLGVLAALPASRTPRVVVVSMAGEDSALGVAALQAGAIQVVQKPTAQATDRLYELSSELVAAVRAAGVARVPRPAEASEISRLQPPKATTRSIVVIGASTGGPQALSRLLKALPGNLPLPVALVLHLPVGYTQPFAQRLDKECDLEIVEAEDGIELRGGRVLVARAGIHLKLQKSGGTAHAVLDPQPSGSAHRPSVDVLFESAAGIYGAGVLGVVLTGMGDDGLQGARRIRAAGGQILTESEASCVVYGMPRSIDEQGLSTASVGIDAMAQEILNRL